MKKILGIGNALVDVLVQILNTRPLEELNLPKGSMTLIDHKQLVNISQKMSSLNCSISAGGSAANTINGLAKLGVECGFIGKIGRDEFGALYQNDLTENGITPYLSSSIFDTGRANTFITPDSERTFATHLGAAVELSADDLDEQVFKKYDCLYVEGYLVQNHELVETAMSIAKKLNMTVALDLGSYNVVEENLEFLRQMVTEYVDILFANEEEARAFTSGKEAEDALDEIASMCNTTVVKIGSRGSLVKSGDMIEHIGIIDANVIDTTGAGDLFAAGFMYGLTKEYSLRKSGQLGALLSGKVIGHIGGRIIDEDWEVIKQYV
ncbi:MAG: adenosine kinase [Salinivirgaceae bacterium]|nr:adenosine kinase [Salinivirgaceae bacterium]